MPAWQGGFCILKASDIDPDLLPFYLKREARAFDVHKESTWPPIKESVSAICDEVIQYRKCLGHQIQHPNRLRRYLEKIILDLLVACAEEESPFVFLSLNKNSYKTGGRMERIFLGSYLTMKAAVDSLVALGYVERKSGYYDTKKKTGHRTRIAATDKLIESVPFDLEGVVFNWREDELVRLKHDGEYIDFADTRYSKSVHRDVVRYNEMAEKTDIRLAGKPIINKYQHAVFHGPDMKSAVLGRMYGGVPQNLKKDRRAEMTINGESVVNLDFQAHHIKLAYCLNGTPYDGDPYIIPGPWSRDDVKLAVNIMLNCEKRSTAVKAVGNKELVEVVEKAHPLLCEYGNLGLRLQREDSDLMRAILNRLMDEGMYATNLHDGLLCRESDAEHVASWMKSEYFDRYKIIPDISSSVV